MAKLKLYGGLSDIFVEDPDRPSSQPEHPVGPCRTCRNAIFKYQFVDRVWKQTFSCPLSYLGWAHWYYNCEHYEYELGTDDEEIVPWEKRFPQT